MRNGPDPDSPYGRTRRDRARTMSESQLREMVDRLLEQCGREDVYARSQDVGRPCNSLYTEEIYRLLGL